MVAPERELSKRSDPVLAEMKILRWITRALAVLSLCLALGTWILDWTLAGILTFCLLVGSSLSLLREHLEKRQRGMTPD